MKYFNYFLLTLVGLASFASIVQAVPVTVPSAPGKGYLLQSTTTGNYLPVSLNAGSNITISTTSNSITISSTGGGGSGTGTISTSTVPTVGQLPYWTSVGYPSLLGSVATTSVTAGTGVSFTPFTVIGGSPITITASGGGTFPFTSQYWGNSTSSVLGFTSGLISTGTSTFTGTVTIATTTSGCLQGNGKGLLSFTGNPCGSSTGLTSYDAFTHPYSGTSATTSTVIFNNGFIGNASSTLPNITNIGTTTAGAALISSIGQIYSQPVQSISTSTATITPDFSYSGTWGDLLGGVSGTLSFNLGTSHTWTALQNFNYSSSTIYSSFINASSTHYFGAGLVDCNTPNSSALTYTLSTGQFGCNSISGGGGGGYYDAWTHPFAGASATTSLMILNGNATTTGLSALYAAFGTASTSVFTPSGWLGIGTTTPTQPVTVGVNNQFTVSATGDVLAQTATVGTQSITPIVVTGSGAGSGGSPNGTYIYVGLYNGKNYYEQGTSWYMYWDTGSSYWLINTVSNGLGVYTNGAWGQASGASTPPLNSSWGGLFGYSGTPTTANGAVSLMTVDSGGDINTGGTLVVTNTGNSTVAGNFGVGTTTPGSVLSVGNSGGINFNPTGTSTFSSSAKGINLTNGCYAIGGVCISGGGGGSGLSAYDAWTHPFAGQSATTSLMQLFGNASSTGFSANVAQFGSSATTTITANGSVGIGTTTPGSLLSIGNTGGINIIPTATSTFGSSAQGININNGCYAIAGNCLAGGTVNHYAYASSSPSNPTGTTTTSGGMMGLGGSITPKTSGVVFITINGNITNSANSDGASVQIRYGTGSTPSNGNGLSGTTCGSAPQYTLNSSGAGKVVPFSISCIAGPLTLSTAYWIDAEVTAITGGTASIGNVTVNSFEINSP